MKTFRKALTILVSFYCMASIHAQTISWQYAPQWDNVEMLGENLFRVTQDGLQGVYTLSGTSIISIGKHRISDVNDHRFLVLGDNNKLLSIWDDTGQHISLHRNYYVDGAWPYFSGGMLAVHDENGAWGFLNMSGSLAIPCKYIAAFPFVNGQASVCYQDGYWAHIALDGKPVLIKGQKLRSQRIRFASTFTKIGDRYLSLVCIEDYMYVINLSGEINSYSFMPSNGIRLYGASIGPQITTGEFTVRFNDIGEISSIIKNGETLSFDEIIELQKPTFPVIKDINTSDGKSFSVGNIVTVSQFQEINPLSSMTILAKENGKWGLISIDRQSLCPSIIKDDKLNQIIIEHAAGIKGTFYISRHPAKTEVYMSDKNGSIIKFETPVYGDSYFKSPLSFEDGVLKTKLGVIMDGIILVPEEFQIKPKGFEKAFSVTCPTHATVSEKGGVSFKILVKNTSSVQDTAPFDILINGGVVRRSVTLNCKESISVPVYLNVNLGDEDRISKSVDIKIKEQDCPLVRISKNIVCERELKED